MTVQQTYTVLRSLASNYSLNRSSDCVGPIRGDLPLRSRPYLIVESPMVMLKPH